VHGARRLAHACEEAGIEGLHRRQHDVGQQAVAQPGVRFWRSVDQSESLKEIARGDRSPTARTFEPSVQRTGARRDVRLGSPIIEEPRQNRFGPSEAAGTQICAGQLAGGLERARPGRRDRGFKYGDGVAESAQRNEGCAGEGGCNGVLVAAQVPRHGVQHREDALWLSALQKSPSLRERLIDPASATDRTCWRTGLGALELGLGV
jgi:hypothetical protein